jgi:hypothetical protein
MSDGQEKCLFYITGSGDFCPEFTAIWGSAGKIVEKFICDGLTCRKRHARGG